MVVREGAGTHGAVKRGNSHVRGDEEWRVGFLVI